MLSNSGTLIATCSRCFDRSNHHGAYRHFFSLFYNRRMEYSWIAAVEKMIRLTTKWVKDRSALRIRHAAVLLENAVQHPYVLVAWIQIYSLAEAYCLVFLYDRME